jgi:hypothetical protein
LEGLFNLCDILFCFFNYTAEVLQSDLLCDLLLLAVYSRVCGLPSRLCDVLSESVLALETDIEEKRQKTEMMIG